MASLLPRTSLLPRSARPSTYISSISSPTLAKLARSKSDVQAQRIPPESPAFINVPNPPQDQSIEARRELKRVRGFLPTPRRIFNHPRDERKSKEDWVQRAAPLPKFRDREALRSKLATDPHAELVEWKRTMADSRRQNLSSGLKSLWKREKRARKSRETADRAKALAFKKAFTAPEREDERLTRGTINAGTLVTHVAPDPLRFERAKESAERTATIAKQKSERRLDALQTLYMKARSFIVTEEQLEAAVRAEFADDHFTKEGTTAAGQHIYNIWDAEGLPMSVDSMIRDSERTSDTVVPDVSLGQNLVNWRQKQVAEELTGGTMD
ncbi:hypothetical protein GGS20DRAFT_581701 [Poronia punctata]|nr:hypothetical protein GGS20DRAFT_581701 [Poronia punctata]